MDAPNGRFEEGAALLDGRKLRAVDAFGKHLFYDFGRARLLHIHLGLFGKFREGEMPLPEPRGALRLRLSTPLHWVELRGPTACHVVDETNREKLLARIGPDPLRSDASATVFVQRIRDSRGPIAGLLKDQSVIGGIGNIYRAELLFRAKLNPLRAGNSLSALALHRLWKEAATLMRAGMSDRRIVTTRPADRPHPRGKAAAGRRTMSTAAKICPAFFAAPKLLPGSFEHAACTGARTARQNDFARLDWPRSRPGRVYCISGLDDIWLPDY